MTNECSFYGSATVGTKGQIVIPQEAREALNIQTGDKLIIIGLKDRGMLGVCPVSSFETFINQATTRLETIKTAVEQSKKEN
ncbi:MAG TPA: AbrB/MazE/SpoVT family DNA-binding domain-containing protein [Candidatus Saccharimonadales bacterium]|nr:AbrB/MazE/SpoVT family DNA-binding domain-containing protein [Candidatus Saccharimonadales bacterium]